MIKPNLNPIKENLIQVFKQKNWVKKDYTSVCIDLRYTNNFADDYQLVIFRDYFTTTYNGLINIQEWIQHESTYDIFLIESILPYLLKTENIIIRNIRFEWHVSKKSSEFKEYYLNTTNFLLDKNFCFTGSLALNRGEYVKILDFYGAVLSNSITRNTSYLVVGSDPGDIKVNDAKRKGIKIITEEQLNRMLFFNKELF